MLSIVFFEELGRTTIRSAPAASTWEVIRRLMPPARERIRTIEATPMAMPRVVRKERERLRRRQLLAS